MLSRDPATLGPEDIKKRLIEDIELFFLFIRKCSLQYENTAGVRKLTESYLKYLRKNLNTGEASHLTWSDAQNRNLISQINTFADIDATDEFDSSILQRIVTDVESPPDTKIILSDEAKRDLLDAIEIYYENDIYSLARNFKEKLQEKVFGELQRWINHELAAGEFGECVNHLASNVQAMQDYGPLSKEMKDYAISLSSSLVTKLEEKAAPYKETDLREYLRLKSFKLEAMKQLSLHSEVGPGTLAFNQISFIKDALAGVGSYVNANDLGPAYDLYNWAAAEYAEIEMEDLAKVKQESWSALGIAKIFAYYGALSADLPQLETEIKKSLEQSYIDQLNNIADRAAYFSTLNVLLSFYDEEGRWDAYLATLKVAVVSRDQWASLNVEEMTFIRSACNALQMGVAEKMNLQTPETSYQEMMKEQYNLIEAVKIIPAEFMNDDEKKSLAYLQVSFFIKGTMIAQDLMKKREFQEALRLVQWIAHESDAIRPQDLNKIAKNEFVALGIKNINDFLNTKYELLDVITAAISSQNEARISSTGLFSQDSSSQAMDLDSKDTSQEKKNNPNSP